MFAAASVVGCAAADMAEETPPRQGLGGDFEVVDVMRVEMEDASVGTEDGLASEVGPDAAVPDPDAEVADPDAEVADPDAAMPDSDLAAPDPDMAAPEPDMALEPDAAPPDPFDGYEVDRVDVDVVGGPEDLVLLHANVSYTPDGSIHFARSRTSRSASADRSSSRCFRSRRRTSRPGRWTSGWIGSRADQPLEIR